MPDHILGTMDTKVKLLIVHTANPVRELAVGLELDRDKLKKTRSEKVSRRWAVARCWEHGEQ